MTCPECLSQLAPSGRLTVIPEPVPIAEAILAPCGEPQEVTPMETGTPAFICNICGKACKNQFGLTGHTRSHKKEK